MCDTARSTTPVRIPVRVCKSPGGMRLLNSISSHRIRRFDKNDSLIRGNIKN
jgi:hypothetical protein